MNTANATTPFQSVADLVMRIFLCTVTVVVGIFCYFSGSDHTSQLLDRMAWYIIVMFVTLCTTVTLIAWCEAQSTKNYSGRIG